MDAQGSITPWPGTVSPGGRFLFSWQRHLQCSVQFFNFSSRCDNAPHDFTASKMGWFNSAPAEAGTPSSTRRPHNSKCLLLTCFTIAPDPPSNLVCDLKPTVEASAKVKVCHPHQLGLQPE